MERGVLRMETSDWQIPPPKDWEMFERHMRDLFEAHWHARTEAHGRAGQPQHGVDIYGQPNGGTDYHGVQCKCRDAQADDTLTKPQLLDEVRKARSFRPTLHCFILATTGKRDARIQRAVRDLNAGKGKARPPFSVGVMFWDDIGALYDQHPDISEQHYPGMQRRPFSSLHQLPPPLKDFTGRKEELEELLAAAGGGGATISGLRGMGGVGKTALALKLAAQLAPRFPDAQFFLDLKGAHDSARGERPLTPAEAMAHVIRSYSLEARLPDDPQQLAAMYLSVLHGKRALLLMDNAADAAQVAPLIPPEGCMLLVTSRWRFALSGLYAKDLDALPPDDACKLLLTIEPRIGAQAGQIAELCGRLPLALRLAGSALAEHKDLPPQDYARRLTDAKRRLELVDAPLSLSYDLLGEPVRRLWSMLAVFPGTFAVPAAAAVWQTDADQARNTLGELLRVSMLDWDQSTSRYRLHDLARIFADSRLAEGDRYEASLRHATHYEAILREAQALYKKGGGSVALGLALLDLEWHNARAGQEWSAGKADIDEAAARLCNDYPDAGVNCLSLRQHPREQIRWLEAAVSAARRLKDRGAEGRYLGNLGLSYAHVGETRRAIEFHEQALAILREIDDRRGEGATLGNLGNAYADLGETRRAIEFYEQRLAIAREIGDRRGEGAALGNLGNAYADLGETRRAIEYHEQALAIHREIGDRRGEGNALGNLGIAYADMGETRRAIEFQEQHLAIAREIGDRRGEGNALGNLGNAYADLGETRRAIEFYEQALAIDRESGDRRGEASSLGNMSMAMDRLGDRQGAIRRAQEALAIYEEIEDPRAAQVRKKLDEWRGA